MLLIRTIVYFVVWFITFNFTVALNVNKMISIVLRRILRIRMSLVKCHTRNQWLDPLNFYLNHSITLRDYNSQMCKDKDCSYSVN